MSIESDGRAGTCPDDLRDCVPGGPVIDLLSRKYAIALVSVVGAHDPVRFGDLEAHLPAASTATLSVRLDELESAGVVSRTAYDELPPRVEYELTRDGRSLLRRLRPLLRWAGRRD